MIDPLSDVLGSIRLTGGVFLDAQFTEPWAVLSHMTPTDRRLFDLQPAQIIAFHFVLSGKLIAEVDGEPAIEAEQGDIVLVPRNEPHRLLSSHNVEAVDAHKLMSGSGPQDMIQIRHGGGGNKTHMVCGFLASNDSFNPLIEILPRMLRVDMKAATSREWMDASMRYATIGAANKKFASSNVMARLSELLLMEAVRQYSTTRTNEETGWLKGVRDRQVGRALSLMHSDLAACWCANELAAQAGMSRSAFVDRFTRLMGVPPIRYLARWRLGVARHQLRESDKTVQQLAPTVGYASEEAFSRAFKREFGVSPSEWRQQAS